MTAGAQVLSLSLRDRLWSLWTPLVRSVETADDAVSQGVRLTLREFPASLPEPFGPRTLEALMPTLDNLERALLANIRGDRALSQRIARALTDAFFLLRRHGAESFSPSAEPFDPSLHEAVEVRDTHVVPEMHVLYCTKRGWTVEGTLVRPASVVVERRWSERAS